MDKKKVYYHSIAMAKSIEDFLALDGSDPTEEQVANAIINMATTVGSFKKDVIKNSVEKYPNKNLL